MIAAADLPGFEMMFNSPETSVITTLHGIDRHDPWTGHFVGGRSTVFIAEIAVTGPDRASEDAFSRKAGYTIRHFPLVPLMGPVVAHNASRPLEIDQINFQFDSVDAAEAWMAHEKTLSPPVAGAAVELAGVDEVSTATNVVGPDDGQHEHAIGIDARLGTLVIQVGVFGGPRLSLADVIPVARRAVQTTQRACKLTISPSATGGATP